LNILNQFCYNAMSTITNNRRLFIILFSALALLLIPLIAMQFTQEVQWSGFDFMIMGILLLGVGGLFELVLRTVRKKDSRIALIAIIIIAFLLVWAELAVGIFGTPFAGS
jgi:ABC-type cobalt transport system substrate-binding protein